MTMLVKVWSKEWEKEFNLKWVRSTSTITYSMMPFSNISEDLRWASTETSTLKGESVRSRSKISSLAGCQQPCVMLWVSQILRLLLGSWTCRDTVHLQRTQIWKSQEWTYQCQRQSVMTRVVFSKMRMSWRCMQTAMDSTRPSTKREPTRRSTGERSKRK